MTETLLDRRIADWLDAGPNRAPGAAFDVIMERVAQRPPTRPALRVAGRPLFLRHLLAAAAAVVVLAGGATALREPFLDAVAPPRASDHPLYAFPETRTILDRTGGPSDIAERTSLGRLPDDEAFVIAAACTGEGELRVELVDPSIEMAPGEGEAQPLRGLVVPCDGSVKDLRYQRLDEQRSESAELDVVAGAGARWHVAVGELKQVPARPSFPAIDPGEGNLLLNEGEVAPATGPGSDAGSIGFDPRNAETVTIHVQCAGDPVTVRDTGDADPRKVEGEVLGRAQCDDPTKTHTFSVAADGSSGGVAVSSDGFSWVRVGASMAGTASAGRPDAPLLPDGLADAWYAEGDGEHAAFGRLGASEQVLIRIDGVQVGKPGGEWVAVATPDGKGGTTLDLWSIKDAEPVARLADVEGAQVFGSWVDATNRQVFYGVSAVLGIAQFHRVAFDGRGDVEFASTPVTGLKEAQSGLSIDDAHFVTQWCPLIGGCERTVYTTATGGVRKISRRDDDRMCGLSGIAGGTMVGVTPECDVAGRVTAQGLFEGERVPIGERGTSAAIIPTADGPRVVVLDVTELVSTLLVARLDGSDLREVARFEHASYANPYLSDLRLPAPDWILLAGSLSDSPTQFQVSPAPQLVNVITGEVIDLPNLPGER